MKLHIKNGKPAQTSSPGLHLLPLGTTCSPWNPVNTPTVFTHPNVGVQAEQAHSLLPKYTCFSLSFDYRETMATSSAVDILSDMR